MFGNILITQSLHPDACDKDQSHRHILVAHHCSWEGAELLGLWWVLAAEEKPDWNTCLRLGLRRDGNFPSPMGEFIIFWSRVGGADPRARTRPLRGCVPPPCSAAILTHLISSLGLTLAVLWLDSAGV